MVLAFVAGETQEADRVRRQGLLGGIAEGVAEGFVESLLGHHHHHYPSYGRLIE